MDLTGTSKGVIQIIKSVKSNKKGRYWVCRCSICGFERIINTASITNGQFLKCNCSRYKQNTFEEYDNFYKVYLPNVDEYFLCDKEDFVEIVCKHKWYLDGRGYVATKKKKLHRIIMNIDDPKIEVDHINGNPLDNRRQNLRICQHIYNGKNLRLKSNNTSGTPGVWYHKASNMWIAEIKVDYKKVHLGYFKTKEEAIKARKEAERYYFKEYSSLNSRNNTYNRIQLEDIINKNSA